MPFEDLEIARKQAKALRELIIVHPGGREDDDARARVHELLKGAWVIQDAECKKRLMEIEQCSRALFSATAHLDWARGQTSGADVLRLQILRELDAFNSRVEAIESEERSSLARRSGVHLPSSTKRDQ